MIRPTRAAVRPPPTPIDAIAGRAQVVFVWSVAAGLTLLFLWAGFTVLDRVTRGTGRVIPQTSNRIVQHFEGGILTEILVKEGQKVSEGAPLLRIDNSFARAEMSQTNVELKARRLTIERLEAESAGLADFQPTNALRGEFEEIVKKELDLFRARRAGLDAQLRVVDDQIRQKELEVFELRARMGNLLRERELVAPRVASLRRLSRQGAVSTNDLLEGERSLQQLDAKTQELGIETPRAEAAVGELRRRREQTIAQFKAEAEKERREAAVQAAKLEEVTAAMQDRSRRSEVLAPISGIVNKLHVNTIGGVVKSGEPLVQLVPLEDSLIVEARLSPRDRAEVWPGLPAVVKISAYDYAIHGGLKGRVIDISPDALSDDKGEPYFRVRLAASAADFGPGKPVVPGMMAQVDILTGRHTVLEYLLRPLRVMRDNAFRQ
jgi:HlyD family type I secretion membrane fusion protein